MFDTLESKTQLSAVDKDIISNNYVIQEDDIIAKSSHMGDIVRTGQQPSGFKCNDTDKTESTEKEVGSQKQALVTFISNVTISGVNTGLFTPPSDVMHAHVAKNSTQHIGCSENMLITASRFENTLKCMDSYTLPSISSKTQDMDTTDTAVYASGSPGNGDNLMIWTFPEPPSGAIDPQRVTGPVNANYDISATENLSEVDQRANQVRDLEDKVQGRVRFQGHFDSNVMQVDSKHSSMSGNHEDVEYNHKKDDDDDDDDDEMDNSSDEEGTICSSSTYLAHDDGFYHNGRFLRSRRNRRPIQERTRQRRQTMQDMARPLKHWLYKHRNNPYPTKTQKVELAHSSHMTLTQVSNWFANARRRLKNTVTGPGVTWKDRILHYNDFVEGNAELLSVSSDDDSEDEDDVTKSHDLPSATSELPGSQTQWIHGDKEQPILAAPNNSHMTSLSQSEARPHMACSADTPALKERSPEICSSLLHRYLQDSCQHCREGEVGEDRKRHQSGSLSSHDFEDMSISSRGSPVHNSFEDYPRSLEELTKYWDGCANRVDDLYWMEISAALTLTSLARSKSRPGNPP